VIAYNRAEATDETSASPRVPQCAGVLWVVACGLPRHGATAQRNDKNAGLVFEIRPEVRSRELVLGVALATTGAGAAGAIARLE